MEEVKLQALADSFAKHGGRKGLGTSGGEYSWSKTNSRNEAGVEQEQQQKEGRDDGLPDNALYAPFVKEGSYNPSAKGHHGDGRAIKRDFSDMNAAATGITESS